MSGSDLSEEDKRLYQLLEDAGIDVPQHPGDVQVIGPVEVTGMATEKDEDTDPSSEWQLEKDVEKGQGVDGRFVQVLDK